MNPELLLDAAVALVRASPPDGIAPEYVDGFVARHRGELVALLAAAFPPEPAGVPTHDGGLRGEVPIPKEEYAEGLRIVTEAGDHGAISEVTRFRMRSVMLYSGEPAREEIHITARVRLDSGREEHLGGEAYPELRRPNAVVPDVSLDGGRTFMAPSYAWATVSAAFRRIGEYAEKASNARKPDMRQKWSQEATAARATFRRHLASFLAWRREWPSVPVENLTALGLRRLELAAIPEPTAADRAEAQRTIGASSRTLATWSAGDRAVVYGLAGGDGSAPVLPVVRVEGEDLVVDQDGRELVVPYWMADHARNDSGVTDVTDAAIQRWMGTQTRGGVTGDQRAAAAAGCVDVTFQAGALGEVRVVCGQDGRRDVWHNIWHRGTRYGYNGGRWAKGMVPPAGVLEQIRARGITAFG